MIIFKLQSIKKDQYITNRKGFSIAEAVIASSILALFATAAISALMFTDRRAQESALTSRATFLAQEGLEAARSIRDEDFSRVSDGSHGLEIFSGKWRFSGLDETIDRFKRRIVISTIDEYTKQVNSFVEWTSKGVEHRVTLDSRLTDWADYNEANCFVANAAGAYIPAAGMKNLLGVQIENIWSSSITLDKMRVSWTDAQRNIDGISIGGTVVWSNSGPGSPTGHQPSGTEINIQDVYLPPESGFVNVDYISLTGNIADNVFDIIFIFSDGSQLIAGGITPPLL